MPSPTNQENLLASHIRIQVSQPLQGPIRIISPSFFHTTNFCSLGAGRRSLFRTKCWSLSEEGDLINDSDWVNNQQGNPSEITTKFIICVQLEVYGLSTDGKYVCVCVFVIMCNQLAILLSNTRLLIDPPVAAKEIRDWHEMRRTSSYWRLQHFNDDT